MKVHKRQSAAINESNGQPLLRIVSGDGHEVLYITGISAGTFIEVMGRDARQTRLLSVAGLVTAGNLVRLGNANKIEPSNPFAMVIAFDEK